MKRICSFLLILLFFVNMFPVSNFALAKIEKTIYAKAKTDCILYKSQNMNNEMRDVYFIVPETYFVVILEEINENCYKVQYDKFIGYVNASAVEIASFSPIVKTLTGVECDIKETSGTQIWTLPSTDGNVLTTISAGFKGIKYISFSYGEIPIGGETNLWYYISYTPHSNSTSVFEGYVYSENVTNLSEIVPNSESNPEILIENVNTYDEKSISLSSTLKTVIIALISVPIILLISIILYKIIKYTKENTIKRKNQNKSKIDNFVENYNNSMIDSPILAQNHNEFNQELKGEIEKFRNSSFVRSNISKSDKFKYPKFPTYNSDDDLL